MDAFPTSRFFRLSEEGVRCDQNGLFIGGAPMLIRSPRSGGGHVWATRPANEQNSDLGVRYGFQIDVATKREGACRNGPRKIRMGRDQCAEQRCLDPARQTQADHRLLQHDGFSADPNERRRRVVVSDMDRDAQYADALATLRLFEVPAMSAEDYSALSTKRLLELFVAAAKQHGMGARQLKALSSSRDPLAPSVGPVDMEALKPTFAQLWAVSVALAPRQPTAQVERMLRTPTQISA